VAKPSSELYSVEKTFVWFALAGMILTISLVLTVGQDYFREWKGWQRKFLRLKYELAQAELKVAQQKLDGAKLLELGKKKAEAHQAFKTKKPEVQKLQKELGSIQIELAKANSEYQELKQYKDSYKYYLEETRVHHDPEVRKYEEKLREITPRLEQAKVRVEELEKKKSEVETKIEQLKSEETELAKEIERLTQEVDREKRKVSKAKPSWAKEILNAPMLDFLRPTLQIQQVVLEDLYDDFHFTKVQKVDRCTTCHLAIDQKGFSAEARPLADEGGPASGGEDIPQPFRAHSHLELYVGSDSPHPLEKFGCTVCHSGNGHSLSFKDTAHTPQNEEQKKTWEKKYHWQHLEKWEAKMLPLNYTEASCAKCHKGVVEVPRAEKLNEGRQLVHTFGCFGCHKIEGFSALGGSASGGENHWKVGPSLEHIGSKVDKDWIVRWLQDPKAFRPTTHMPKIFNLSNTHSPEDRRKNQAVIEGIATYLQKQSTPVELKSFKKKGDPKEGEKLFKAVGCLGCHSVDNFGVSEHGPNLSGIGTKTTPEWIYTWLKDPKHYFEKTRMPSLRLSDKEASHLTSYLVTLKNETFAAQPLPDVEPAVVEEMLLGFLRTRMPKTDAERELGQMDPEAKLVLLGEKMISHQGCFACHDIKGFEQAKPIGTELSKEGQKEIDRLDFGFVPIERTRHAWFIQKLKEPRIFDQGKIKEYLEKLKMPDFGFTDAQVQALTTFLLSQVEEPIPLEMRRELNLKEQEIEAGRLLVKKLNCQGCHLVDGKGGRVKELLPDAGLAPPPLEGEGAKVQEHWLYYFLKEPKTIRPWLAFRMPTFGFKHEELTTLVKYFSHLSHQEIFFEKVKAEEEAKPSPEMLQAGQKLFVTFQCAKCHEPKKASPLGASFLAPDLTLSKERLKPQWIADWLKDPQTLQPGTMMPAFFPDGQSPSPDVLGGDASKQIHAIRDYLLQYQAPLEAPPSSQKQ